MPVNHTTTPDAHTLLYPQNGAPAPRARRSSPWPGVLTLLPYAFVLVVSVLFVMAGAGQLGYEPQLGLRIVGYLGIFLVLTTLPPVVILLAVWRRSQRPPAERTLEGIAQTLRNLNENVVLSDDARRVLNRQTERELLRRAIEEDIQNQAWDAAMVLCNELADRFGYRADAEEFRARIELARSEILERRVADSIARLDGLIVQRRWDVALRDADRIRRLYPDSPRCENLRHRVEQARGVYKQDLERRFLEASSGNRIEEAMALLKELDLYLTESEAEPFREMARGVITKARDNLGAQFKLAVQDRQWAAAASLGRRIIAEFPNTRMAQEVRGMMDGILAKANQGATTGV